MTDGSKCAVLMPSECSRYPGVLVFGFFLLGVLQGVCVCVSTTGCGDECIRCLGQLLV